MNKNAAILFCFWFATLPCWPQTRPPGGSVAVSRSGQFIIRGVDPAVRQPLVPGLATNRLLVRLEPTLLTISCERIKRAMLNTLNVPDQWRGKISVVLHPFQNTDEDIVITSERFSDTWRYRLDLPDVVESQRLVRAVTQLLLLEMANRSAGEQPAQLPAWLAEGMPQLLLATSDIALVLQPAPPGTGNDLAIRQEMRDVRQADFFKGSQETLRHHAPLTLAQLGQPPEKINGEAGEVFRASAVFFLHELLELPSGGADLAAMLPELAWDPDWRMALLHGFYRHFKREVDLEKWWALQTVYISKHTPEKTWSRKASLEKLNGLLLCPLDVQLGTNEPAMQTTVSLQAIIRGWEFPRQSRMLREKITLLAALKLRAANELIGLAEDYRRVLQLYLYNMGDEQSSKKRPPLGWLPALFRHPQTGVPAASNRFVKDTLLQLDILDRRREAWGAVEKQP